MYDDGNTDNNDDYHCDVADDDNDEFDDDADPISNHSNSTDKGKNIDNEISTKNQIFWVTLEKIALSLL